MSVFAYIASQLGHPQGWFGREVMTRLLNRGNIELLEATIAHAEVEPSHRVLDVGFGGGRALELLATRHGCEQLVGVDRSAEALEHASGRLAPLITSGRLELHRLDVLDLSPAIGRFDRVLSTNTIYFWPELTPCFEALVRVLEPGGWLCLGFGGVAKMREFSRISQHGFHFHDEHAVAETAGRAGLDDVELRPLSRGRTRGDFILRGQRPRD